MYSLTAVMLSTKLRFRTRTFDGTVGGGWQYPGPPFWHVCPDLTQWRKLNEYTSLFFSWVLSILMTFSQSGGIISHFARFENWIIFERNWSLCPEFTAIQSSVPFIVQGNIPILNNDFGFYPHRSGDDCMRTSTNVIKSGMPTKVQCRLLV